MTVQVSRDNISVPFIRSGMSVAKENETIEQDAGRAAVLKNLTVMAKKNESIATTGTADVGNTGDGIVSSVAKVADYPSALLIGDYNLECTAAGEDGRVVGAVTPDGGNTGDGTVTGFAVAAGEVPKVGDFVLTCNDPNKGGTASGAAVFTGTGNGTMDAIVPGTEVIEGAYIATCIDDTVSGSEIFEVIDPNGVKLGNMTVAVAYSNNHFATTLNDGVTDFVAGDYWTITMTIAHGGQFTLTDPDGIDLNENIVLPGGASGTVVVTSGGITFTITDGGTDFALDDFFTMVIAASEGGVFKLEDPNGNLIAAGLIMAGAALGASVFYVGGITFTITDGATDFASGDIFLITINAIGKWVPLDPAALDGAEIFAGIYLGDELTAAALIAGDITTSPMLIGACCTVDKDQLVFENSALLTTLQTDGKTIEQAMNGYGIFPESTIDVDSYENA